jgi:hypothetical protein
MECYVVFEFAVRIGCHDLSPMDITASTKSTLTRRYESISPFSVSMQKSNKIAPTSTTPARSDRRHPPVARASASKEATSDLCVKRSECRGNEHRIRGTFRALEGQCLFGRHDGAFQGWDLRHGLVPYRVAVRVDMRVVQLRRHGRHGHKAAIP